MEKTRGQEEQNNYFEVLRSPSVRKNVLALAIRQALELPKRGLFELSKRLEIKQLVSSKINEKKKQK